MSSQRLFDELVRSEPGPRRYDEDTFTFLNRVSGIVWERIRAELDGWYAAYPDETRDLQARFRNRDHRQHYGAWWELYIYTLLSALGFRVSAHPEIPGSSGRPDFLAVRRDGSLYVEAVTVFSGLGASAPRSALQPAILDIINTIDATNFFVNVQFIETGHSRPRRAEITGPIAAWLDTLDPDAAVESMSDLATTTVDAAGWKLELRAMPRSPEHRGRPDNRLVGIHGTVAGYPNDREALLRALERKKKQHGTPDRPLVIAALATNGFVDDHDVIGALFGSGAVRLHVDTGDTEIARNPDGFWIGRRGPASRKISAVLIGVGVLPETCARSSPELWHHFAPTHSLDVGLPFANARGVDDALQWTQTTALAHDLLGLPTDWPGPEPPFGPGSQEGSTPAV